jgi:hypothetical protein
MAIVKQFWAPHENQSELFQANTTAEWSWQLGDNSLYWGFAVRPKSANTQVEVTRQWTTSDNDFNQVEHFVVTCANFDRGRDSGWFLQFTAIEAHE